MSIIRTFFTSLEQIYAVIPDVGCKGLCHEACGPIMATEKEVKRARDAGVDILAPARRILELRAVTAEIAVCPALVERRCSIYDVRPLICRIYGATRSLQCEFGCRPQRWLTERESAYLVQQAYRIGGGL